MDVPVFQHDIWHGWLDFASDQEAQDQINHSIRLDSIVAVSYTEDTVTIATSDGRVLRLHPDEVMTDESAWTTWRIWSDIRDATNKPQPEVVNS